MGKDKCFCGWPLDCGVQPWQHSPACDLYAPDLASGHIGVATDGEALTRNRVVTIEAVKLHEWAGTVRIQPLTSRHNESRGWIEMQARDFDRLCELWLESRGKGVQALKERVGALEHVVSKVLNAAAGVEDQPDIDVLLGQLIHGEFDEIITRAKQSRQALPDKLQVLVVNCDEGPLVWVCEDEDTARHELYKYVKEWWEKDGPDEPMPKDSDEAISVYFGQDTMGFDEWSEIVETGLIRRVNGQ